MGRSRTKKGRVSLSPNIKLLTMIYINGGGFLWRAFSHCVIRTLNLLLPREGGGGVKEGVVFPPSPSLTSLYTSCLPTSVPRRPPSLASPPLFIPTLFIGFLYLFFSRTSLAFLSHFRSHVLYFSGFPHDSLFLPPPSRPTLPPRAFCFRLFPSSGYLRSS